MNLGLVAGGALAKRSLSALLVAVHTARFPPRLADGYVGLIAVDAEALWLGIKLGCEALIAPAVILRQVCDVFMAAVTLSINNHHSVKSKSEV